MSAVHSSVRAGIGRVRRLALVFLGAIGLGAFIWWGYSLGWTGFGPGINAEGKWIPAKMLWDWLTLAGVPVMLALVAYLFSRRQKQIELQQTTDIQRENALQLYFNEISKLLFERNLRQSKPDHEVRVIARALTLSVLRHLDGERKGAVMRFLLDTRLVQQNESAPELELGVISLAGADLTGANLASVNLENVDLSDVDLHGANLDWAKFKDAIGADQAKLDAKWRIVSKAARRIFPEDLLRGQDMRNANLSGVSLTDRDLGGTDLTGAILDHAWFGGAKIDKRTALSDKWRLVYDIVNHKADVRALQNADLDNANLRAAYLVDSNLTGARLQGTDLSKAKLDRSVMSEVNAFRADFSGAWLNGVNLEKARLWLCKFSGAQLAPANCTGATFYYCDFRGADLSGANLEGAEFQNSKYDGDTKWPAAFPIPASGLVSVQKNAKPG